MPDAADAKPSPSKFDVFLRRLLSFVILWTIVLSAMFSGNKLISDYVFLVIVVVLAYSTATPQISPSPWHACASPMNRRAPGLRTGR